MLAAVTHRLLVLGDSLARLIQIASVIGEQIPIALHVVRDTDGAARAAETHHAYRDAIPLYRKAIELIDNDPNSEQLADLLLRLGAARAMVLEDSSDDLMAAFEMFRSFGATERIVAVMHAFNLMHRPWAAYFRYGQRLDEGRYERLLEAAPEGSLLEAWILQEVVWQKRFRANAASRVECESMCRRALVTAQEYDER